MNKSLVSHNPQKKKKKKNHSWLKLLTLINTSMFITVDSYVLQIAFITRNMPEYMHAIYFQVDFSKYANVLHLGSF